MKTMGSLLDTPRARGAFALRAVMRPPWSLRILAESPLTLITPISGDVWVVPDGDSPLFLEPGDIAITRTPLHYTVACSPEEKPQVVVHRGQDCRDLLGNSLHQEMTYDVRTWGNDPQGSTLFLVGAYERSSDISPRLLRALPPLLVLSRQDWQSPLVPLLCDEMLKDEPGQAAVLDRLLDLLLTAVLKAWLAAQDKSAPLAWRVQEDRIVERALQLIHDQPARPWTLEKLALEAGASRASLARRFQNIVGEAPMAFLTQWRMAMAADLLCQPNETVETVSGKVGYATASAFSSAFKRTRGISPREHKVQLARQLS